MNFLKKNKDLLSHKDKMSREFYEVNGELRCKDPSCEIAQCGQCNKEENKRKKAEGKKRREKTAAEQKLKDDAELVEKTKGELAAGRKITWSFDKHDESDGAGKDESEADGVIQRMQYAEGQADGKARDEFTIDEDSDFEVEKKKGKALLPQLQPQPKKQKTSERVSTTWNHKTRSMFLKAVAKYNPFGAAVKKDAWAKVAEEMHKSTTILKDTALGDFCVYTDGHGLQVFYERRRDDMDKKLKKEGATSGHGGFTRSREDIEEHNLMETCVSLEKDAIAYRESKREHNRNIESLKNNDVNDAIIAAAENDSVIQLKLLKVLQARVRQAKLECKLFEKDPGKKGMKFTYSAQALKDMEDLEKLKPKDTSDGVLDSTDTEAQKVTRGGSLASAIQDLTSKMPNMAGFTNVDPAAFATSFFETKQKFAERKTLTLKEKLEEIDKQLSLDVITQSESDTYKKQVKDQHFLNLGIGI